MAQPQERGNNPTITLTPILWGLQGPLLFLWSERWSFYWSFSFLHHHTVLHVGVHTQGKAAGGKREKKGKLLPYTATSMGLSLSAIRRLALTPESSGVCFRVLSIGFAGSRQERGSSGLTPSWPESERPAFFSVTEVSTVVGSQGLC